MVLGGKLLLFCGLAIGASSAAAAGKRSAWVRIGEGDGLSARTALDLLGSVPREAVSFGLTEEQRELLYTVSNGTVDLRGIYRVALPDGLQDDPRLLPGYLGEVPTPISPIAGVPTEARSLSERGAADPELEGQWWIESLRVPEAWQVATGRGVTIADCDSGYYTQERDLSRNLVLDQRRDFSDASRPTVVTDGAFVFHGTAVAAIMAGVRDGVGTHGIAFDSKIVPLQNYNYDRALDNSDKEEATARCVLHALRLPSVKVVVVENQTPTGSSETFAGTREAIRLAIQSGITVVSAAGNNTLELATEARYDTGSIIVGAVRRNGRRTIFTNWGSRITVSAYGEGIKTLYGPGGQIETFGGTTAAAAQVGAAVALMLEANPQLTPAQVRSILLATRRFTPDTQAVGGLIDVYAAVLRARQTRADWQAVDQQNRLRAAVQAVLAE